MAPVDHLGLIDLVARVVGRGQTGRGTDRTVNVDHPAAGAADQVVVVVAGPVLVACRRPGGLDAPDETLVCEDGKGVVHRLAGDDTDLGANGLGDIVRRAVRSTRHRRQHGQALSRDLETVSVEQLDRVVMHRGSIDLIMDKVKN
jgi:hypothetical protein